MWSSGHRMRTVHRISLVKIIFDSPHSTALFVVFSQPLLQWKTLGPIVRAAAKAHTQKIPPAVALIGTELAAAAVNLVPSGEANVNRLGGCTQQQGVMVLSSALRLVAEADTDSQGAPRRTGESGLYAQWVRSCFAVGSPTRNEGVAQGVVQAEIKQAPPGHGQEQEAPELCGDVPGLHGSMVREPQYRYVQ